MRKEEERSAAENQRIFSGWLKEENFQFFAPFGSKAADVGLNMEGCGPPNLPEKNVFPLSSFVRLPCKSGFYFNYRNIATTHDGDGVMRTVLKILTAPAKCPVGPDRDGMLIPVVKITRFVYWLTSVFVCIGGLVLLSTHQSAGRIESQFLGCMAVRQPT